MRWPFCLVLAITTAIFGYRARTGNDLLIVQAIFVGISFFLLTAGNCLAIRKKNKKSYAHEWLWISSAVFFIFFFLCFGVEQVRDLLAFLNSPANDWGPGFETFSQTVWR